MPDYNPNSIWGSKEKKYTYDTKNSPAQKPADGGTQPTRQQPTPPGHEDIEQRPPSFFHRHRLLFFTIGLLLGLALIALVAYLILPAPTPNVAISFSNPGIIVVGVPFPLTITVSNKSNSVLQNGELNITLPSGIVLAGDDPSAPQSVITEAIGTLSSQTINPPETVQLIVTGNPGTSQSISAGLTYQTAATDNTQFESSANTSLVIGSQSALSLSYTGPSSIFSGQNFDLAVNYQNNTTSTLQGVELKMQYPPAYTFVSASGSSPTNGGGTLWNLGTLGPNATGTLILTGNIVGPTQAQYQLTGTMSANFSGQNYPAYSAAANFAIAASPLSLSISLNNSPTYVSNEGDTLDYTLTYTNNSDVVFQTLNISAALLGQMYDFSSLKSDGSFNSQNNTITWYAANAPQLLSLAPGQSGSVNFTVNTLPSFPIRLPSNKDFSLNVTAQIESPTVPPNTAGSNTVSITSLTTKVGGDIALAATGYSHEPTRGITNTGPYPPKVNMPSEDTIHWDITNYSTDAENVTVSAYLESGTTFTGVSTSSIPSSTPTYNASTGLISWTIPYIPATTGVISPPAQMVFQVTNTPAVNQVGQTVTLLGPTTLTATDVFTSSTVQASAAEVTTQFPNDPSITGGTGDVTQ